MTKCILFNAIYPSAFIGYNKYVSIRSLLVSRTSPKSVIIIIRHQVQLVYMESDLSVVDAHGFVPLSFWFMGKLFG
jgi:hypothetical protein